MLHTINGELVLQFTCSFRTSAVLETRFCLSLQVSSLDLNDPSKQCAFEGYPGSDGSKGISSATNSGSNIPRDVMHLLLCCLAVSVCTRPLV